MTPSSAISRQMGHSSFGAPSAAVLLPAPGRTVEALSLRRSITWRQRHREGGGKEASVQERKPTGRERARQGRRQASRQVQRQAGRQDGQQRGRQGGIGVWQEEWAGGKAAARMMANHNPQPSTTNSQKDLPRQCSSPLLQPADAGHSRQCVCLPGPWQAAFPTTLPKLHSSTTDLLHIGCRHAVVSTRGHRHSTEELAAQLVQILVVQHIRGAAGPRGKEGRKGDR